MYIILAFFAFVAIYYFASKYTDNKAHRYYESRRLHTKTEPKVYDIMHEHLPDMHQHQWIHDVITALFLLPLLRDSLVLQEYLGYWITVFCIRMIFNNTTILPKYKHCEVNRTGIINTCYDKIFSGHFSSVFLAVVLYVKYKWISLSTGIFMLAIVASNILLTRSHYTVDILVAFLVCVIVYQNDLSMNRILY